MRARSGEDGGNRLDVGRGVHPLDGIERENVHDIRATRPVVTLKAVERQGERRAASDAPK